jgi:hypothetical protein
VYRAHRGRNPRTRTAPFLWTDTVEEKHSQIRRLQRRWLLIEITPCQMRLSLNSPSSKLKNMICFYHFVSGMLTHCKLLSEFQEPEVFWPFITHQRHIYSCMELHLRISIRRIFSPTRHRHHHMVVKHRGVFITQEFESMNANCFEYGCFLREAWTTNAAFGCDTKEIFLHILLY